MTLWSGAKACGQKVKADDALPFRMAIAGSQRQSMAVVIGLRKPRSEMRLHNRGFDNEKPLASNSGQMQEQAPDGEVMDLHIAVRRSARGKKRREIGWLNEGTFLPTDGRYRRASCIASFHRINVFTTCNPAKPAQDFRIPYKVLPCIAE